MPDSFSRLQGLPKDKASLAHAYIIEGQDAFALMEVADGLSQSILCRQTHTLNEGGCGQCQSCQLFDADTHPDLKRLGLESNAIGVDEIRQVSQFLEKTSQLSGAQVVVLNRVESMTENAANALLKTLEEPTAHSYLILLTESKHRLMATIRSRCQLLHLMPRTRDEIKQAYPELPDYVLGYSNHATSLLDTWREDGTIDRLAAVYQAFMLWLKRQSGETKLAQICLDELVNSDFVRYLLERRVRQLLLKGGYHAPQAMKALSNFASEQRQVKGQNKSLALVALLQELAPLVR